MGLNFDKGVQLLFHERQMNGARGIGHRLTRVSIILSLSGSAVRRVVYLEAHTPGLLILKFNGICEAVEDS
ncbi:hypothetical protein Plhal304r1_c010g0040551 [Plasmopara halstedii]